MYTQKCFAVLSRGGTELFACDSPLIQAYDKQAYVMGLALLGYLTTASIKVFIVFTRPAENYLKGKLVAQWIIQPNYVKSLTMV